MHYKLSAFLIGSLTYCLSLTGQQPTSEFETLTQSCADLGSKILELSDDSSCVFSPFSIFSSLSMVYEGAEGQTAEELSQALFLKVPKENLSTLTNAWKQSLANNSSLDVANSLWIQNDFAILESFQNALKKDYQTDMRSLDLRNTPAASAEINEWVKEKTHNMIPKFLEPSDLNEATRLIAMSTLYFQDRWAKPFLPKGRSRFKVKDGVAFVKMISKTETCDYNENEQFKIISIPLEGSSTKFVALLPKTWQDFEQIEKNLSASTIQGFLDDMQPEALYIEMPKFKLDQKCNLNQILQKAGVTTAFTSQADFSGINGMRNLFIDSVLHQAVFELNENGIKAAAATGVVVGITSALEPQMPHYRTFIADRPFLFFLVDDKTNTILMMGKFQPLASDALSD